MSKISNEDKNLFAQALKGVSQIKATSVIASKVNYRKPDSQRTIHARNQVADDCTPLSHTSSNQVSQHEALFFQHPSIRKQEIDKLRKGQFQIEITQDLHGLTELAAEQAIHQFIQEGMQFNCRYGLLIHGKGYRSESEHPTIKNLVNHQLRQYENILAFCSAKQKDGGVGAVYIFFKGKPA